MNLERERFNEWIKHYENHDVKIDQLQRAFMWQAWKASASRDGYKMVPVEPTQRMIEAAIIEGNKHGRTDKDIYKAMIGAVE